MLDMTPGMIALITGAGLLLMMAVGLPVAFSLLATAVSGYILFAGPQALYAIATAFFHQVTVEFFIAIPLFILMAMVLDVSGFAGRLYETMYRWMAGLGGGLAIGTVAMCTVIAATSGLAATGTVVGGLLAYPEMTKRGYNKGLAMGCIPAGGALGPIIPPSIAMIIVGTVAGISVGRLFFAAVIPGLMMSFSFMLYIWIRCLANPALAPAIAATERANWRQKFISLRETILPLMLIFLVLGSIYTGVCTPTEASGVGAVGALICLAAYRNFNRKNLHSAVMRTLKTTGMIMWLLVGAGAFASLYGVTGVTHFISETLLSLEMGPVGVLAVMLGIIFVLGMFLEMPAIVYICLPVMMPVAIGLGYDQLWFGLIFSMSCILGLVTPPFAMALFVFKGLGYEGVAITDLYRAILPYVLLMVTIIVLCIVFPILVLWLPGTMIR